MARYAISDIHGCCKTFRHLVEETIALKPEDELYLLGDYIDRGPDSKGVLDFIMELKQKGFTIQALCGNHEAMLKKSRDNPDELILWLMNGGDTTLESFHVGSLHQIPAHYWEFMGALKFYLELDDFILVHAGLNFKAPDPLSDTESMLWIRFFDIEERFMGNRSLVHGHTPVPLDDIYASLQGKGVKDINLDGGCVFKERLGYLTALNLDTLELHAIKNRE